MSVGGQMGASEPVKDAYQLVSDLKSGEVQILTIVEQLGPTLTSTNHEDRVRGVRLLTDVLVGLPSDFLNADQLSFIATFYADRLKDNHNVIPAVLQGILTLANMKNLPSEAPRTMLKAIFDNVPCQQQVRSDRQNIYTIMNVFAMNRPDDVKAMGLDFTLGLIFSMDGERDPRNLIYLFSILPSVLKIIKLEHVAEEMFEVMACYFPVDFNTPQDDVNSITRNDLADKLSFCLCALPTFAEFCIPLLLDKLDSNLRLAKLDSLKLLKQGSSIFTSEALHKNILLIWQALQKELSQDADIEIRDCAHEALSGIVNNLCSNKSDPSISETFLKNILIAMQLLLIDAKTKARFESPIKVFLTVAKASEESCNFIMKNVNPQLIAQFNATSEDVLKSLILDYLISAFEICKHWDIASVNIDNFNSVVNMCLSAAKSSNIDLKLLGLKSVSKITELVSVSDALIFQDVLNYNINHEHSKILAEVTKNCLISLAAQHPACYEKFIEEFYILDSVKSNESLLRRRLDILCCIVSIDDFTKNGINSIYSLLNQSDPTMGVVILESLYCVLKNRNIFSEKKIQEIQTDYNIMRFLLEWITLDDKSQNKIILNIVSNIIKIVMRSQRSDYQLSMLSELMPIYVEKLTAGLEWTIVMIEAMLNSTKEDVIIDHLDTIIKLVYKTSIKNEEAFIYEKAFALIANVLNKYIHNAKINEVYANHLKAELSTALDSNAQDFNCIILTSWIAKSFLLNSHTDATYWLSKLSPLLNDKKWGLHVADGFKLIMSDDDHSLNKACFCKVNFLYKQKVFQQFLQFINTDDANNKSEGFFKTWSYIIQAIPKSVLLMELPKISSIIVECLNFEDPDILLPILETLSYLSKNKKSTCGLQTLLPRCLRLCNCRTSVKVRIASLQCLFDIANNYPTPQLLPHKQDIILELAKHLDDPKRLVRNIARKARTRWFLVGSPGEENDK